jgi:hypothetical protein
VDLEGFFGKNAAVAGREGQLHLYDGEVVEILAWMISTDGYWESFDFVHFKPVREPLAALTAACQAWPLVKPGGTMVVDFAGRWSLGPHPGLAGIAAFARAAGGESTGIGSRLIVLRKGGML